MRPVLIYHKRDNGIYLSTKVHVMSLALKRVTVFLRGFHYCRSHAVGALDNAAKRVFGARRVIASFILIRIEVQSKGTHMPAYGKHLVVV